MVFSGGPGIFGFAPPLHKYVRSTTAGQRDTTLLYHKPSLPPYGTIYSPTTLQPNTMQGLFSHTPWVYTALTPVSADSGPSGSSKQPPSLSETDIWFIQTLRLAFDRVVQDNDTIQPFNRLSLFLSLNNLRELSSFSKPPARSERAQYRE